MKVVHVCGAYVAGLQEGISRNVHDLCEALRGQGVEVAIDAAETPLERLNRRRTLWTGARDAGRRAVAAWRRPGSSLVHFHVSLPSMALWARLARLRAGPHAAPLVVHAWNAYLEGPVPAGAPWRDRWAHRLFNGPEAARLGMTGLPDLLVSSRFQAAQAATLGFAGRVHVVPNGVDAARFRPADAAAREAARTALGVTGDPVVLYYGHRSFWKGVDVLARALPDLLARHRRAQAVLATTGYGGPAEALARAVARAGLEGRVLLAGPSHVPTLHAAADLAVLPARAAVGTSCHPNVLLECMAAGLPVVASRVGSVQEVVSSGENGLLVAPGDVGGLAAALDALASDPALRRRLGAAARRTAVDRFGWDVVAREVRAVYARVEAAAGPNPAALPGPADAVAAAAEGP